MNADTANACADAIERNIERISAHWQAYNQRSLPSQESDLAARFAIKRALYISQALDPAIAALRTNNYAAARHAAALGPILQRIGAAA